MARTLESTLPQLALTDDTIREIANTVNERSVDPLTASKHIVASQVETDRGVQPAYLLVGSAIKRSGFTPTVLMTAYGAYNAARATDSKWSVWAPTARGGARHGARAVSRPSLALWSCLSGPNQILERVAIGGLGVDDNFDLGVCGWRTEDSTARGNLLLDGHANVLEAIRQDPDRTVGFAHVIKNNGEHHNVNTIPHMYGDPEPEGQFVSFGTSGHEVIASYPVTGAALLSLPGIVSFTYPTNK